MHIPGQRRGEATRQNVVQSPCGPKIDAVSAQTAVLGLKGAHTGHLLCSGVMESILPSLNLLCASKRVRICHYLSIVMVKIYSGGTVRSPGRPSEVEFIFGCWHAND